ncbi:unnamed protein product [Allacma fusca]|uniref:Uncharacterized protein n=1 Tax=Allacma fusca TaxID=39272 RepID=A0A8J2NZE5_9HEXA|nr:unnamed protein product [Allacma fusca]
MKATALANSIDLVVIKNEVSEVSLTTATTTTQDVQTSFCTVMKSGSSLSSDEKLNRIGVKSTVSDICDSGFSIHGLIIGLEKEYPFGNNSSIWNTAKNGVPIEKTNIWCPLASTSIIVGMDLIN